MKKTIITCLMAITLFIGGNSIAFASTTTDQLIMTLRQQIASLIAQIATLQEARSVATSAQEGVHTPGGLHGDLREGVSGEQVRSLQAMLATDRSIYPEGKTTGYYGKLTKEAVKRFQKRYGLGADGKVGPATIAMLNKVFGEKAGEGDEGKYQLPCSGTSTPIDQGLRLSSRYEHGDEDGHESGDDHDEGRGGEEESRSRWGLPTCVGLPIVPLVATTSSELTITNVDVSAITSTGATVLFVTSKPTTAKIFYGTGSPVSTTGSPRWTDTHLTQAHTATLSGLSPGTTYYFVAVGTDATNTTLISGQGSFTTSVMAQASPTFTLAQVAAHNTSASCYTAVSGGVYDITSYIAVHPGGSIITALCGKDGTTMFNTQHGGQSNPAGVLASLRIGRLVP